MSNRIHWMAERDARERTWQERPLRERTRREHSRRIGSHGTFLSLLVIALSAVFPALTAATEGPVVLKLWDYHVHDKKFRQNIFKEFNKANPDIKVEYTSQVSGTYQTVLDAAFRSGTPPDIFVPNVAGGLPKLIEMGWVMPLDSVAPSRDELEKWMAKFPQAQQPFVNNQNVFDGKVYSWPSIGQSAYMLFFYNTKLFKEAGLKARDGTAAVPETWDNVRQFAKKITEIGQGKVYGIVHGIKNPQIWDQDLFWSIALNAGYPFYGLDWKIGRYDFHQPGFKAAVQLWLDLKKDGSVLPGDLSMDDEQAKFKFATDLAGMMFSGWWAPGGFLAVNDALEFDVVLPPVQKAGDKRGGKTVGSLASNSEYVVSSKIQSKPAAWKVVQFMTSADYQEAWVKAGGGFSVFPEYNKPEYFPHPTNAKIAQWATVALLTSPMYQLSQAAQKAYDLIGTFISPPYNTDVMQGQYIGVLGWDAWDDYEKRSNEAMDKAIAEAQKQGFKVTHADFVFPDWDPKENYPPPKAKK